MLEPKAGGYRGVQIRCPGCQGEMQVHPAGEAEVDVCASCRAAWIDWFDGELRAVARDTIGALGAQGDPLSTSLRPNCPRCALALPRDASMTPSLLRCSACFGVFVTRDEIAVLLATETIEPVLEPSLIEKIKQALVNIFDGKKT